MRILVVTGRYAPAVGGVEAHTGELARLFVAAGHEVDVATHLHDPVLASEDLLDGVHVRRFPLLARSRHLAVSPLLLAHLRAQAARYDVVHAHGYHCAAPVTSLLAGARPLVVTPHYHRTGHSPFRRAVHVAYRPLGRRALTSAAQVICVSRAEADLLTTDVPALRSRLHVISNGVDVAALRAAEPLEVEGRVLLAGGRLERYKQVDRVVEAVGHLADDWQLVVVGDGPDRPRLEAVARRAGLERRVRFLGRLETPDLRRWYRTARTFVTMSTDEAQSITLLELLTAGARVVASDIPAHRDVARSTGAPVDLVATTTAPRELARAVERASGTTWQQPRVTSWDEAAAAVLEVYALAAGGTA